MYVEFIMFSFWYMKKWSQILTTVLLFLKRRGKQSWSPESPFKSMSLYRFCIASWTWKKKQSCLLEKGRMYFLHYCHDLICILLFYTQRQSHASRIFFHSPYCFHVTVTHTWFKKEVIWSSQLTISLRSLSFLY